MGAVSDFEGSAGSADVRTPLTARGRSDAAFTARDWGLLLFVGAVFGSSFLFIEIGLTALAPPVITLIRLVLGFLTLSLFPRCAASGCPPPTDGASSRSV